MTTMTTRRGLNVYGAHGQPIAIVSLSRATYLSSLLAECDFGHCYLLPDDVKAWLADGAICPRCRRLGLTPGGKEAIPHDD